MSLNSSDCAKTPTKKSRTIVELNSSKPVNNNQVKTFGLDLVIQNYFNSVKLRVFLKFPNSKAYI